MKRPLSKPKRSSPSLTKKRRGAVRKSKSLPARSARSFKKKGGPRSKTKRGRKLASAPVGPKLRSGSNTPRIQSPINGHSDPRVSVLSQPQEIKFYRANEKPYGALSNLYKRTIEFEGQNFLTAEHAYQAGKARTREVRDWILQAPTPALVAMAAHGLYSWDIVPNWSQIKYDRMRGVLRAKFTQHDDLKHLLLQTGDVRLVEAGRVANSVNRTWGEVNGKGLNMLGRLLMELRAALRDEASGQQTALSYMEPMVFPQGQMMLPYRDT